jgi:hypothetical protein
MGDLRINQSWMQKLLEHLVDREGAVRHFYCDKKGLVTIAVGYLVDTRSSIDNAGRKLAGQLASRDEIRFTKNDKPVASVPEVEEDWQRVKDYGRKNAGATAKKYANIALLRLEKSSVAVLLKSKVKDFLNDLYRYKSFLLSFDERVAMAFIDVRYNPAGIALFGKDPRVREMWNALNPQGEVLDIARAVVLFEQLWAFRDSVRYSQRHWRRVQWLREGLEATGTLQGLRCI